MSIVTHRQRGIGWLGMSVMAVALGLGLAAGCETVPESEMDRQALLGQADATIQQFQERDPTLEDQIADAHAVAVFPSIGKGGAGIGGAFGRGVVYQDGEPIGWTSVSQGSIGLQLGGQSFAELILFRNRLALETFKDGKLAFAANASAVAAESGAAAQADYEEGVKVFTMTRGGLMYEASIGGQEFDFIPMD